MNILNWKHSPRAMKTVYGNLLEIYCKNLLQKLWKLTYGNLLQKLLETSCHPVLCSKVASLEALFFESYSKAAQAINNTMNTEAPPCFFGRLESTCKSVGLTFFLLLYNCAPLYIHFYLINFQCSALANRFDFSGDFLKHLPILFTYFSHTPGLWQLFKLRH